ncbi:hypothetical protein [Streptomyces sp. NPDC059918]|uniref:hypothetical protein n=1 Tax=unclassified Streptomyces TaxID=2593676 RepID=UPI00365A7556
MPVVRTHRFTVDPEDLDEFCKRRAVAVDAVRAVQSGLGEARLVRLEDGTFVDTWLWESAEQLRAAVQARAGIPEVYAARALTKDFTDEDGEVVSSQ